MTGPRKPRRGRGRNGGGRAVYGRRTPPPERTGLEGAFLSRMVDTRQKITIHFNDGDTLDGTVESFDQETIEIRQEAGPTVVYRKSDIRYFSE